MDLHDAYAPFVRFVSPELSDIPPASSKVNNIFFSDLADAAKFGEVFADLKRHFQIDRWTRVNMVSHNGSFFDEPVLRRHAGTDLPSQFVFIDTLPILRRLFPTMQSYTLADAYRSFFHDTFENGHRADADVIALRRVYVEKILPSGEEELNVIDDSSLTSIKFIAAHRASMITRKLGVVKKSELRARFATRVGHLDRFLCDDLSIDDIGQRMCIVLQLYGYARMCVEVRPPSWLDGALNDIDYYISARYKIGPDNRPVNRWIYQRGLMEINTIYDW